MYLPFKNSISRLLLLALLQLLCAPSLAVNFPEYFSCRSFFEQIAVITRSQLNALNLLAARPSPYVYQEDLEQNGPYVFVMGGINPDEVIENMKTITGMPVDLISQLGQPLNRNTIFEALVYLSEFHGPLSLFRTKLTSDSIREGHHLKEVLLSDNQVVRAAGKTHQQLAEPLLQAIEVVEYALLSGYRIRQWCPATGGTKIPFLFADRRYWVGVNCEKVRGQLTRRSQLQSGWLASGYRSAPFYDFISANWFFEIEREGHFSVLRSDALTPHLIYRYGFYQDADNRIDPQAIIDFFY